MPANFDASKTYLPSGKLLNKLADRTVRGTNGIAVRTDGDGNVALSVDGPRFWVVMNGTLIEGKFACALIIPVEDEV